MHKNVILKVWIGHDVNSQCNVYGMKCLWTTGEGMKWPSSSAWTEVALVLSVLVWSERHEVIGIKWLVWSDIGMKCQIVWNDAHYELTLFNNKMMALNEQQLRSFAKTQSETSYNQKKILKWNLSKNISWNQIIWFKADISNRCKWWNDHFRKDGI